MLKGYAKTLMYGGGFLILCLVGAILFLLLQPNKNEELSILMNARMLAWASWMGTVASIIGLIASVCAAIKAKKSAEAATAAKNSTLNIVYNFNDAKLSGKIKALIERIKHIETLMGHNNKLLLIYIIDEILLDLSEIKSEMTISDENILSCITEVRGTFQDSRELIHSGNLTIDDRKQMSKDLGRVKIKLAEIAINIQKIVEENVNE